MMYAGLTLDIDLIAARTFLNCILNFVGIFEKFLKNSGKIPAAPRPGPRRSNEFPWNFPPPGLPQF
jgi:hypothetical protein